MKKPHLKEKNFLNNGIGQGVIAYYNAELPRSSYISSSSLIWEVMTKDLSDIQRRAIDKKLEFFNTRCDEYQEVKANPTRENIRRYRVANCGELADSAIDLFPPKKPVMRANICVQVPVSRFAEKGVSLPEGQNDAMINLQHVFLIYHNRENDKLLNVLNMHHSESYAVDIWRRETKSTSDLIMQHLREAGVSEATMTVSFPRSNSDKKYHYYISSDGTIKLLDPPINGGRAEELAKYFSPAHHSDEKKVPEIENNQKNKGPFAILYLPKSISR